MENYYTVSQKSDCSRVHEVLGLGFTRDLYIYLFIYLFYFIFNSGPVPRAWHTDPRPLLLWALIMVLLSPGKIAVSYQ